MSDLESKRDRGGRSPTPSRDLALARIAGKQFGVISLGQLLAIGFSLREIQVRARRGLLNRIHKDVFAVGHTRIVPHARLVAALLTCGPASFLSHRTAAAVWGLRAVNTRRIEVTMPGSKAPCRRSLIIHRTRHDPDQQDLALRTGLRVSSVPRMLVVSIRIETPHYTDFSSFCDPTHRSHLNSFSFRYFGENHGGFGYYSKARMREISVHVKLLAFWRWLGFQMMVY